MCVLLVVIPVHIFEVAVAFLFSLGVVSQAFSMDSLMVMMVFLASAEQALL